jgi:lysophospholipase L1-like esterase
MVRSCGSSPWGLVIFAVLCGCSIALSRDTHRREVAAVKPAKDAPRAFDPQRPQSASPLASAGRTEAPAEIPTYPPYVAAREDRVAVPMPIENADRLDHYFGKLTLTELGRPGAITRAAHWGDSVLGGDGLTERIRRRLQERFGDAGHGFHAIGRYHRGYRHRGVRYEEVRAWDSCLIIFKCQRDTMRYGYGGATSTSRGNASSRFQTETNDIGDKVARFELWYQKRPDGGGFEIRVDGEVAKVVDSRADTISDDVETVRVTDGEHSFEVAATGSGVSRAYGVVMERDGPGVVWDELSLIGSFTKRLDYQDAEHLAGQIKRRDIDLLVFMFGGNDLARQDSDLKHRTDPYEREYARVIRKFRAGKPEASCMLMSVTDHGQHVGDAIVSRSIVPRLVGAQRRVAKQEGCAFYDTFGAMGGDGTIERWRKADPPLAARDLGHPTLAGQRYIGDAVYHALMHAYASYRRRHDGQPLPLAPVADR